MVGFFLLQEMVQNLHNKSILNIIKGVFTLILMKMGNYRRVVYEEKCVESRRKCNQLRIKLVTNCYYKYA